ncbi:MAG: UDP-N-acetylglucosamine 1-carboxyvinyltransferase [Bacteroidia bacterium]|nr:UDP-N-acetylglucosamine 1-carboxyvinyltransferase [Bacteroidia bacterium]MCX7763751.1 UDP-N-acetylglucosamine 1-carboxyvinyltransferase [Bacteroidia bacterium]MDW8057339.1 UDP-N-acetylglucosamine 1-carboxyvinyltransferase [Bacteroidia bacterium]
MRFIIEGGARLSGTYTPQGAKNEALQVLAAALLTSEAVEVDNLPFITDVQRQLDLIELLGAKVERVSPHKVRIQAETIHPQAIISPEGQELFRKIRGSILLVGPLLARCGEAYFPRPGGDKIGRRRIDTHLLGFLALGATLSYDAHKEIYHLVASRRLQGKYILLEEASVTGTANLLMAATLAEGETILYHAACEPYIQQLGGMLSRMGAEIEGLGTNRIRIVGRKALHGTHHTLLPDVIEIGSIAALSAMTQSPLRIAPVPAPHLEPVIRPLQRLGIPVKIEGETLSVDPPAIYEPETIEGDILTISDHTWPGTPPDMLSVLLVVATQAAGTVLIHQKMFESRLFFVDRLIEMGAQVVLCDPHRALVIGLGRRSMLRGIRMSSPDIRAGMALLIAALSATGRSVIEQADQIERGYERLDERLRALGAQVWKEPKE